MKDIRFQICKTDSSIRKVYGRMEGWKARRLWRRLKQSG